MAIKKRRVAPRRLLENKVGNLPDTPAALTRLGELLADGYGNEGQARVYFKALYTCRLQLLQSMVKKAEAERTWAFLAEPPQYIIATELYVLASVLYEKYPSHTIMSDGAFDGLARFLLRHRKKLSKDFREWYAITAIDLRAGTGHRVQIQEPIRWMIYLITGEELPHDSKATPRVLRKTAIKRSRKASGSGAGSATKSVRRIAKRRGRKAPPS